MLRKDGSYPRPPLALVEVQGYAYQARMLISSLLRRVGEAGRADTLKAGAARLQTRFLKEFWMDTEGYYCLALEQGGRQAASVTSNAAQVLWTGIATPAHAACIIRGMRNHLFAKGMAHRDGTWVWPSTITGGLSSAIYGVSTVSSSLMPETADSGDKTVPAEGRDDLFVD